MTDTAAQEDAHTPGPWTVEPPWSGFSAIRGPNWELVFGLAAGTPEEKQPDEVCHANAALIASAPALLEENKRLRRALGFAASAIKSGESWTKECDEIIGTALKEKQP